MSDIYLGSKLAELRRKNDLTQEDIAHHLGVSKAAVSKWELGQNYPDITLLPQIASYFGITVDELIDYQPKVTSEELSHIRLRLTQELRDEPATAYNHIVRYMRDYFSDWEFYMVLTGLLTQVMLYLPEQKEEIEKQINDAFEHIENKCNNLSYKRTARVMYATMLPLQGKYEEAIEILESVRPKQPLPVETLLGEMYTQNGDKEKALMVYHNALYYDVTNCMGAITRLLPLYTSDQEMLQALLKAGNGIVQAFDLEEYIPTVHLTYLVKASSAYLRLGEEETAFSYIDAATQLASSYKVSDDIKAYHHPLHTYVEGISSSNNEDLEYMELSLQDMMQMSYRHTILAEKEWLPYKDDPRFVEYIHRFDFSEVPNYDLLMDQFEIEQSLKEKSHE